MAEHTQAESVLRASEEHLRMLADAVPQIIWANDASGPAHYFNRRWYDYTGLTFEQSAGPGWEVVVHPDDAPSSKQKWRHAFAAGEPFDAEYRLRRSDGEYRWFIGRNVPLRSAAGDVTGWFGTATDIQELKEAQAAAREREQQFRRALEDAPIPVIMQAEDGQVLQISRTWADLTGYAQEEIPTFDTWLQLAQVQDADGVREHMKEVFSTPDTSRQTEFQMVTRRGERRHWLFRVSCPGSLGDTRRYAVGMAIDLTDRKRAEAALLASQERLRLVVESALEHAIISTDLQRRVTSWNSGAERMLGHLREEIAEELSDLIFTPEDRAAGMPAREAEIALTKGRAADERWRVRKDGSRFWGSGVMLPMYERPGSSATGFLKILRDETHRQEAQEALESNLQKLLEALREADRARADAEAAARAKDDFLAALSHELRTPLNPVLLLASEAADSDRLPEEVREDFAAIRNNVQLEARLIDDLLDLTRVSRGKLPLDRRETDAHAVLQETAAIVRSDIVQKNIDLVLHLQATHTQLHADAVRLQQVFWNVLKNAVKFTGEGGRVQVETHNPSVGDRLVISVNDTGIGMTAVEIDRVFDAFAQGDHAVEGRSHRFGGLGLGLAISRMLVELHGGSIRAFSPGRGRGSTFEIDLPLAQETPAALSPPGAVATGGLPPEAVQRLRRERILLVEDHAPTRQALGTLLRRRGLVVETASSAEEARQLTRDGGFSLLLSDIGLPDGDGYNLMEELRERHGLRGVALTGYGTDEDLARSRRAGFSAHLTKPISAQALDRTLALLAVEGGQD